ncbi:MAG: hypothetical protein JWM64_104 [Frankiales bacterium]|nr:hypothetical protein [Frankiales bacterium]
MEDDEEAQWQALLESLQQPELESADVATLERLAGLGVPRAMARLGVYLDDDGADTAEALRLLKLAAGAGEPEALSRLASYYPEELARLKTPITVKAALQRAADRGDLNAQISMGLTALQQGQLEVAWLWFDRALAGGRPAAGIWIDDALGGSYPEVAVIWWRRASQEGRFAIPTTMAVGLRLYDDGQPELAESVWATYAKARDLDGAANVASNLWRRNHADSRRWWRVCLALADTASSRDFVQVQIDLLDVLEEAEAAAQSAGVSVVVSPAMVGRTGVELRPHEGQVISDAWEDELAAAVADVVHRHERFAWTIIASIFTGQVRRLRE